MNIEGIRILLAEDDTDDCLFFEKALKELKLSTQLKIVSDGEQLMNYLNNECGIKDLPPLPDIVFLDLSMPRKTGYECLTEIKESEKLKGVSVVVLSTSFPKDIKYEQDLADMLTGIGAYHFVRKPSDFEQLKELILNVLKNLSAKKAS